MAEATVAIVINKSVAIKALLEGERHNFQENISWIETQMKTLQSYLTEVVSKNAANFINSIGDLAQDVEDILDTYFLEIESHKTKGPFGFLKHPSCMPCYAVTDRYLSLEMNKVKKIAAEIKQFKCDITAKSNIDGEIWNQTDKFQKKLFGREETVQKIEAEIFIEKKKCRVISIVGTGGVGKTTVARDVYLRVRSKFDCSAMVYVSEESNYGEILFDIAKQVGLRESRMKQNMEEHLYSFLCSKKFVIFFDDVTDKWDVLKDTVMTDSRNGSRIIVTCREQIFSKSVFHLDILNDSEEKELFYNLILPTPEDTLSVVLKNIGDKIVQKCGGLPLAIEVAAGLLRAKERSERSWNELLERMSEGGANDSLKILDLSYQDLPAELKPFFLYFGIFPANCEMSALELIKFWIPERLVVQLDAGIKPEEIVHAYVDKLVARNLIQVSRKKSDGRVKRWRIHRFLHNLCTRKAEEINFFCNWDNLRNADVASTARIVVTNSSSSLSDNNLQNFAVPRKLRTLHCFGKGMELANFIKTYASELRFLQFLTIEVDNIVINIPVEIANLSGLLNLALKGQFITIPSSIQGLKKLQAFEVRSREVPENILKIKHLKHLFLTGVVILNSIIRDRHHELEVDLPNLESLHFDYQYGYHLGRSSFKKLPSFRTLVIVGAEMQTLDGLSCTRPFPQKLEDLKLRVNPINRGDDIPTLDLSRYENLQWLYLYFDSSVNITCSLEFPKNLVRATLGRICTQDEDPLKKLQKLPILKVIKLKKCIAGTMDFSGQNKFPQLQILMLSDTLFDQVIVDEIGMPKLSKFIYRNHPHQTSKVPEKLEKVMVERAEVEYVA
ncbi:Apoptotic ATPase [Handroanthus impetiginosus]|uniref:Apoptotic ATPase n=1 Tax=Handroanthus impetiginosus TaxID=429701 RepID=A0A2G9G6V6_9LAMI|nr:Apoptotic ATPase [Handroanthus impetiginosus]